jgi:hypothetical protein
MFMAAHLRNEARASGWPNEVVSSLSVAPTDSGFDVRVPGNMRARVMDLEYGTPSTQPTAAIRRFSNRQSEPANFFVGRLSSHIKGGI